MKLIQKTTRYYLGYTVIILGLGGLLFYFLIKIVLMDSIDEALTQEKEQIISNLNYEKVISEIIPSENVHIYRIDTLDIERDKFRTLEVYDSSTNEGTDYRQLESTFLHQGRYYKLLIRVSLEEAENLLNGLFPLVLIIYLLLLGGFFIINTIAFKSLWEPFYRILTALKSYDLRKNQNIAYQHSDIQEFNELSKSIEKMTDRISRDYQAQKEFNENSSHELQTPLAIIRNKLDLLIQSPNLQEEELTIIESLYSAVNKLTALNKGLILLNKIENNQFYQIEKVDVNLIIERLLMDFEESISEKKIVVSFVHQNKLVIDSNHILTDILITNLINNAIKHNTEKGWINISLDGQCLTITNSGLDLKDKAETMFERFKKNAESSNSVGLGLSIVKKICQTLNFKVEYTSLSGEHQMRICF